MKLTRSVFALLVAVSLRAQAPATDTADPIEIGGVTVTGSLRSRLYLWDWFQPTAGNNSYQYSGNIFRISFSQNRDTWDWNAEFAVPFLLGLPSGATGTGAQQGALGLGSNYVSANSGSENAAMIFPKQLYFRFDGLAGDKGHTLQIGRFEFADGSEVTPKSATLAVLKRDRIAQRLIGTFGFSDVGRSFDGIHYAYDTTNNNFTFVGAVPTRGVFQVDGWGWNRIGFGYASYTHQWGSNRHAADTRLFFIEYDDFRHILKTDNRPLAVRRADLDNIRINTFGGHSVHTFETEVGTLDLLAWGAVQTGRWGVQAQRASAFDVEGGFQPKILPKVKPWFRSGYTYGSGDGNPNDNTHGTFFQMLPTPRTYARFPFFNMMNTEDLYGIMLLRPHPKVTVSSEFHSLRLTNANDLWYSGGGAFQPWTFGFTGRSTSGRRSLANLYDTQLDYRLNRTLTLTGYVGYAQGLAVMEEIYPKGKDGKFGYLEFLYRF
ncbi:MAG: alginate export family protein [Bryobacteraceae bacterium]